MKITIDTKEDSPEDLRKIIRLLSELINQKQPQNVGFFDSPQSGVSQSETSNLMAMFDQPTSQPAIQPQQQPTEKKDIPSVEPY